MKLLSRYRLFFVISLIVIIPGVISLVKYGLNLGIDFTGGSLVEISYILAKDSSIETLQYSTLTELLGDVEYKVQSVQTSGDNQIIIRTSEITNEQKDGLVKKLEGATEKVEVLRFETIGPSLSKELLRKTLMAVVLVSVIITGYVWRQFKDLKFGITAVLAMFHDSLVLLGAFSLLGHFFGIEVDVLFVTALLTTLSFSIHDTIVVFDRIRELKRKMPRQDIKGLADVAVLETLSRSINNSVTIILMLLALYLLGGESIKHFALALLIGAVTGTYSSSFTAVPLLLEWGRWEKRR